MTRSLGEISVALSESSRIFRRRKKRQDHFATAVLRKFGYQAIYVEDGDPKGLEADLLILFGNARTFHRYRKVLQNRRHKARVAIWQIDPLPPLELDREYEARALKLMSWFEGNRILRPLDLATTYRFYSNLAKSGFGPFSERNHDSPVDALMARTVIESYGFIQSMVKNDLIDRVFVSTVGKQRFLSDRGIASEFEPVGYNERMGDDRHLERDIDVLFIGKLKDGSRRKRLEETLSEIRKSGAKIHVAEKGCYGEARTLLVNRSKIVLNILKYPWDTPWNRWGIASACGAAVVSEALRFPEPLIPGTHYVEAPFERLPIVIEKLLSDPEERNLIADCCAELFKTKMNIEHSVKNIVERTLCSQAQSP